MTRKDLDLGSLSDFRPRSPLESQEGGPSPEKPGTGWSRREAPQESQFTIRARLETIERFKKMCRPPGGGRFTYAEMLDKLMDKMEGRD